MKYTLIFTLLLVAAFSIGITSGQTRFDELVQVPESDPVFTALKEWQVDVEAQYKKSGVVISIFSPWFELPFDSLTTLLSKHRFFTISGSEKTAPGKEEVIGLAMNLSRTVVCDPEGKIIKTLSHWGNYEEFGELLHASNVSIRSHDDAKLVWNAFCDSHQRHWHKHQATRIDEKTWHLGDHTIDKFHYYYEVLIDRNSRVLSAKLRADEIPAPQPPFTLSDPLNGTPKRPTPKANS